MNVYRLINEKYKGDFSGMGAFLHGGRWNYAEHYMVYAAAHISLSLCEILVHQQNVNTKFVLQTIELSDDKTLFKSLDKNKLDKNWDLNIEQTQEIGTSFLKNEQLLYYIVPSVVVKQEHNILINPKSKKINKLKLIEEVPFDVDQRLIKNKYSR